MSRFLFELKICFFFRCLRLASRTQRVCSSVPGGITDSRPPSGVYGRRQSRRRGLLRAARGSRTDHASGAAAGAGCSRRCSRSARARAPARATLPCSPSRRMRRYCGSPSRSTRPHSSALPTPLAARPSGSSFGLCCSACCLGRGTRRCRRVRAARRHRCSRGWWSPRGRPRRAHASSSSPERALHLSETPSSPPLLQCLLRDSSRTRTLPVPSGPDPPPVPP